MHLVIREVPGLLGNLAELFYKSTKVLPGSHFASQVRGGASVKRYTYIGVRHEMHGLVEHEVHVCVAIHIGGLLHAKVHQ